MPKKYINLNIHQRINAKGFICRKGDKFENKPKNWGAMSSAYSMWDLIVYKY